MRRAFVVTILLGACNANVDPPWQLEHDRIIAVRAEPPRLPPGAQARIDLLVGFEAQPVTTRAPDVAYVVTPNSLDDTMTVAGDNWIVTAPSEQRLAAARAELGLLPDAPVPLRIGVSAVWPNPVMSPTEGGFNAFKTVWLGETASNPPLTGLLINGSEAPAEGTELVVAKDMKIPLFVEADDSKDIVNWLTSCGEMHDYDLHSAYLTVGPDDPQDGELAVVVRDEFGGVSWRVWPIRAE